VKEGQGGRGGREADLEVKGRSSTMSKGGTRKEVKLRELRRRPRRGRRA